MKYSWVLLAAMILMATTCNKSVPADAEDVPFRVLESKAYGGFQQPGYQLITNQEEFVAMWERAHANAIPAPAPPEMNPEESPVICAFMGTRNSGGYSITVESVKVHKKVAYITLVETGPGEGCMTTSAITSPYVMAVIPDADILSHEFSIRQDTTNCLN